MKCSVSWPSAGLAAVPGPIRPLGLPAVPAWLFREEEL